MLQQPRQVAQACSDIWMVRAQRFLVNSQGSLVKWFGFFELALAKTRGVIHVAGAAYYSGPPDSKRCTPATVKS